MKICTILHVLEFFFRRFLLTSRPTQIMQRYLGVWKDQSTAHCLL